MAKRKYNNMRGGRTTEFTNQDRSVTARENANWDGEEIALASANRIKEGNGMSRYESTRIYKNDGSPEGFDKSGHVRDNKSLTSARKQMTRITETAKELLKKAASQEDKERILARLERARNTYNAYRDYRSLGNSNG